MRNADITYPRPFGKQSFYEFSADAPGTSSEKDSFAGDLHADVE